jgi:benzylsuccinate CoA-transferase BbsF subunit
MSMEEHKPALDGLKVVEFAVFAAGPMVGKHLAEQGATVVHVESRSRPDGFRVHYPPYKDNQPGLDRTGSFAIFNDSKYGVTLNLKSPRGLEVAKKLVGWADVLIENFAPGVIERLGLGYQAARQVNPSLVYLSSCNMGQTGPKASQRGFGSQLTSQSGFTYLAGYPEQDPMLLYGPYIDFVAVGFGLIAVLAALDHRRRTGEGQYIDLAQYETGLQFILPALLDYETNGRVMTHHGNRDANAAPHNAYPCRGDAWCAIAVFGDDEWRALCQVAASAPWTKDARFATHGLRKQHEDALDQAIAQWTRDRDARQLMETLQAAGVEAMVVNTLGDIFSDPQLQHRKIWRQLRHTVLGTFDYEAPPYDLSDSPATLRASPLLGEHNRYVYREIVGMSDEEISSLEKDGVIE